MVQYGNMSEVWLAPLLSECVKSVFVCVSQEVVPALCLVASRDGGELASC